MKNKLYRINHRPGQNTELVVHDLQINECLNRKWNNYRVMVNDEDKNNFEEGLNLGIKNIELSNDKRLNNVFFKRGYLLGKRKYAVLEEQKIKELISSYVYNDIPLEACPDYIKNNQIHRTTYTLEKCKQRKLKK